MIGDGFEQRKEARPHHEAGQQIKHRGAQRQPLEQQPGQRHHSKDGAGDQRPDRKRHSAVDAGLRITRTGALTRMRSTLRLTRSQIYAVTKDGGTAAISLYR